MRGEHDGLIGRNTIKAGSSPHARGTLMYYRQPGGNYGIIPACAGNTRRFEKRKCCRRDHPRMRGEHTQSDAARNQAQGSSPHARETPFVKYSGNGVFGIIPACAGNTRRTYTKASTQRDHPRMRGEHIRIRTWRRLSSGSSPHARGTRPAYPLPARCGGIIPACAGNTEED